MIEILKILLEESTGFVAQLKSAIFEGVVGIILGSLLTVLLYSRQQLLTRIKTRNVRHFWKQFQNDSLTIVISEYPKTGEDRLSKIAQVASLGWLISKGMALALAAVLEFAEKYVTERKDVIVTGDRSGTLTTDNIVILGSPALSPFSRTMYMHLNQLYEIPYSIEWDEQGTTICLVTPDGIFEPHLEDGMGEDYAFIIKAQYQKVPAKFVVMICGCYMWGTQAAADAITDPRILNEVARDTKKALNIAFAIKTRVVNNGSTGPELDIDSRNGLRQICALQSRQGPTL